jgi:selenocysteine lyase/cysteine desulfurase
VALVTADEIRWNGSPGRDEAGSPNVVGAVALAQAILSLQEIGMDVVAHHETELTAYALRRLSEIQGVELYGPSDPEQAGERLGTIPFIVQGVDHYKVAAVLSFEGGIGVRNGLFCAHPYMLRLLGISGAEAVCHHREIQNGTQVGWPGLVRASFGCYNTTEEVDWFVERLACLTAGHIEGEYERDPASGSYWPRGYQPDYGRYFALNPGPR